MEGKYYLYEQFTTPSYGLAKVRHTTHRPIMIHIIEETEAKAVEMAKKLIKNLNK